MDEHAFISISHTLNSHKDKEQLPEIGNGNVRNNYSNPSVLISTLTLTEDHPLMSFSSPESPPGNAASPVSYTINDTIKSGLGGSCNKDLSLKVYSEDECPNSNLHSVEFCSLFNEGFSPNVGPHRNTSKNNLYISDSIISPDSNKSPNSDDAVNSSNIIDDSIFYVKSTITPNSIDSDVKLSEGVYMLHCNQHVSEEVSQQPTSNNRECKWNYRYADGYNNIPVEQGCRISNSVSNASSNGFCALKRDEDCHSTTTADEDTHCFTLRRSSWSQSDSSINSLCNCNVLPHQQSGHQHIQKDEHLQKIDCKMIPEYSFNDEMTECRKWLKVTLPSGERKSVDMKVIEPYKRVLSHGGYALSGRRDAIVVFSACFLPDTCRVDYNYVMDNLFLYVLTTMDQLVTDDYILVYLHGSASKRSMPTFHWLKKCYQLIDRRLRKSLKHLYLVHPTFWLKSVVFMTRPFISSKFFNKLTYVYSLEELSKLVPVECAAIPEKVKRFDSLRS